MTTTKIRAVVSYGWNGKTVPGMEGMNEYTAVLHFEGRRMTIPFYTGKGWTKDPEAFDVVTCLASDLSSYEGSNGFEEWARDMGYDTDSRKALQTYRAVERSAKRTLRFLGETFIAEMQKADDQEAYVRARCE